MQTKSISYGRVQSKKLFVIIVLGILAALSLVVSIRVGAINIGARDIFNAIVNPGDGKYDVIVRQLRIPRTLVASGVGICLSLSGCILQGVMRNNLASPSTIGVTAGASFVGYLTLVVFPKYYSLLPIGTIVGAFMTTMLIYGLAYKGGINPTRMILSGLAVSALFGAFNDMIKVYFTDRIGNAQGFLVGGLNMSNWNDVRLILPFVIIGLIICMIIPNKLNILMLGDEVSLSLGLNVQKFRLFLIVVSSFLAGASVSVAGLISFVGLIVPHIARLIVGSDHRYLIPAATLLSVSFLNLCDSVGRVIILPSEVPVSVIIALLGAPFFLYLLRRKAE